MKRKILIVTSAFPYFPGEQFFEDEIQFWGGLFHDIYIAPLSKSEKKREVPVNCVVDLSLAGFSYIHLFVFAVLTLFSALFWREVGIVARRKRYRFPCFVVAYLYSVKVNCLAFRLGRLIKKIKGVDVVYCYWNAAASYAACVLKRRGLIGAVVARAHGYDLYEERRLFAYMPIKRQFVDCFDYVFPVSPAGRSYLHDVYGFKSDKIPVRSLGVLVQKEWCSPSPVNQLSIVSVSNCIKIKRVDKIISAISLYANCNPNEKLYWRHIGGGGLLPDLIGQAEREFPNNVDWNFFGAVEKSKVFEFYQNNEVDFIINVSDSEGVPVSIMEAMSFGIPALATDVGGVSALVNNQSGGSLLSDSSVLAVVQGVFEMSIKSKNRSSRELAKEYVTKYYCSELNYKSFVNDLLCLAERV